MRAAMSDFPKLKLSHDTAPSDTTVYGTVGQQFKYPANRDLSGKVVDIGYFVRIVARCDNGKPVEENTLIIGADTKVKRFDDTFLSDQQMQGLRKIARQCAGFILQADPADRELACRIRG
ncbi:MAG: hypothetical protein P1U34_12545 [Coxiellaceae bacterium]|nr:hypothetical protein [Coxiellaceae bacterium]